jgi:hypothetical protein
MSNPLPVPRLNAESPNAGAESQASSKIFAGDPGSSRDPDTTDESSVFFNIFGLQRTGTNLARLSLVRNFAVKFAPRAPEWKHGPALNTARTVDGRQINFILCVKNPYAWIVSCYRYFQRHHRSDGTVALQFLANPAMSFETFVTSPTYEFKSPVHRWNEMYFHWMAVLPRDRTHIVRHEDQLTDPLRVLRDIQAKFRLVPKQMPLVTEDRHVGVGMRLGHSMDFGYYANHEYMDAFTPMLAEFVDKTLDWNLMSHFDYPQQNSSNAPRVSNFLGRSTEILAEATALDQLNDAVKRLPTDLPRTCDGRGLVICAGGAKYLPCAWVCLNMLRRHGCKLPVELWHLGEAELPTSIKSLMEPLNTTCVDAFEIRRQFPIRHLGGWELKPFAMLYSRFREVLLIDADNVVTRDPSFLFETPQFQKTGAVFWPDFDRLSPERSIWKLTGVPYQDEPEFETGQILIDKCHCVQPLFLTLWFNHHSDFWYRHLFGDKETFHMAWRKLEWAHSMPKRGIFPLESTMCQHDFDDRRIFQHRNMAKWQIRGNRRVEGFEFEEDCVKLVEMLAPLWSELSGIAFYEATDKSATERSAAERLAATVWTYNRVGYDSRPMTFRLDGTVGDGSAGMEVFWDIREIDGMLFLDILSHDALTCRLKLVNENTWAGRWIRFEEMPIELTPSQRTSV